MFVTARVSVRHDKSMTLQVTPQISSRQTSSGEIKSVCKDVFLTLLELFKSPSGVFCTYGLSSALVPIPDVSCHMAGLTSG